jgi:hypothetical protein
MVPMLTPVFLDVSTGEVIGKPAPASALDRMRLRPRPPQVPEEDRLAPKVVEVPVETGQREVSIEGGAPSLVEEPDGRSSEDGAGRRPSQDR